MDATVRRSSGRVHTLVALTVIACVSLLVLLSGDSGARSIVLHDRREIIVRRGGFGSTTLVTTESTSSSTSSSLTGASVSSRSSTSTTSSVTSPTRSSSSITSTSTTTASIVSQSTPLINSTTSSDLTTSLTSTESTTRSTTSTTTSTTQSLTSSTSTIHSTTLKLAPVSTVTPLTEVLNPTPVATINLATNSLQTPTTTSILPPVSDAGSTTDNSGTSAAASGAAQSSGFWQNKGAVAATFVIVSLVLLAIGAFVVITCLKRRSARKQDLIHEELFEKFSDPGHRSNSPSPSLNAEPMDAFASRDVAYSNPFQNYGGVETQHQRVAPSAIPVQHPDYYNQTTTAAPSQYLSPSSAQTARHTTAPTAFRDPGGRNAVARDSYQQSIDSFYGGVAGQQPSSSGYAL